MTKNWNLEDSELKNHLFFPLPWRTFVVFKKRRWNKRSQFETNKQANKKKPKQTIHSACTNQFYDTATKANPVKLKKWSGERRKGKEAQKKTAYTWVASFPGHLSLKCMLHTFSSPLAFKLSFFMMIMKMAGSRCFILTMKEREKCDSKCS